ncbi:MAG: ABC transporter ATP-binding protein [Promethearchaeota archaeon]
MNFQLKEGETLVIAGPSGSGKSTLSYAMNGIIPWRQKGFVKGDIKIFGKSFWDYDFSELSKTVGLVKQNPLEQLVTFSVKDEIAFGLENLNYSKQEIESRVEEVSKLMGISHILDRSIEQLSGGQKQLTILSSFLVMNPKILILDEPIAFLDQESESLLLNQLKKLIKSKDLQLTLVIIEHRLSRVLDIADKLLVLDDIGKVALKGEITDILKNNFESLRACNVRVPWLIEIFDELNKATKSRLLIKNSMNFQNYFKLISNLKHQDLILLRDIITKKEIRAEELEKYENLEEVIELEQTYVKSLKHMKSIKIDDLESSKSSSKNNSILETKNLSFIYPNSGVSALNNLSINIQTGDFVGLVGPNGSGKTTLLYLLANLYQPTSGEIIYKNQNLEEINPYEYAKKVGFIFQNPENMIFKSTIKDELLYAAKNFGILGEVNDKYVKKLLNLVGNESPMKNPFNLSWGQKRRLNLSSIFVYNPEIILLDEPFIGQDQRTIDSLIETLYIENKRGKTIIISSHDYHLLLKYTKRIIELNKDGTLQNYDTKSNYFSKHSNLGPIILLKEINKVLAKVRE